MFKNNTLRDGIEDAVANHLLNGGHYCVIKNEFGIYQGALEEKAVAFGYNRLLSYAAIRAEIKKEADLLERFHRAKKETAKDKISCRIEKKVAARLSK
jgi:hypothetical protein